MKRVTGGKNFLIRGTSCTERKGGRAPMTVQKETKLVRVTIKSIIRPGYGERVTGTSMTKNGYGSGLEATSNGQHGQNSKGTIKIPKTVRNEIRKFNAGITRGGKKRWGSSTALPEMRFTYGITWRRQPFKSRPRKKIKKSQKKNVGPFPAEHGQTWSRED